MKNSAAALKSKGPEQIHTLFPDAGQEVEVRRMRAWLAERINRALDEGLITEEVMITPVLARVMLERNPGNRNLRAAGVERLATDIRNDDWALNGESIKFSECGWVNDGQHRLNAIIAAGRAIRSLVTFGCTRESRMTLDQGHIRTPGDFLSMDGQPQAEATAATVALLWQYEARGAISHQSSARPTKVQIVEASRNHPDVIESVRVAPNNGINLVGGRSLLAFCHYVFAKRDKAAADAFIRRLVIGDELTAKDPIFVCRQRLLSDRRLKVNEKAELIFRTWNTHRRGRKCSIVKLLGALPPVEA